MSKKKDYYFQYSFKSELRFKLMDIFLLIDSRSLNLTHAGMNSDQQKPRDEAVFGSVEVHAHSGRRARERQLSGCCIINE